MISLTINGQTLEVPENTTVLQAAEQAGIIIPTLCHHKDLTPYGGCRLCVVEIQGARLPATSCTMPVSRGMVVQTESPALTRYRRTILELLLFNYLRRRLYPLERLGRAGAGYAVRPLGALLRHRCQKQHGERAALPGRQRPEPVRLGGHEQVHHVHALRARLRRSAGALCVGAGLPRLYHPHCGRSRYDHAAGALRIVRRVRGALPHRRAGQQDVGQPGSPGPDW